MPNSATQETRVPVVLFYRPLDFERASAYADFAGSGMGYEEYASELWDLVEESTAEGTPVAILPFDTYAYAHWCITQGESLGSRESQARFLSELPTSDYLFCDDTSTLFALYRGVDLLNLAMATAQSVLDPALSDEEARTAFDKVTERSSELYTEFCDFVASVVSDEARVSYLASGLQKGETMKASGEIVMRRDSTGGLLVESSAHDDVLRGALMVGALGKCRIVVECPGELGMARRYKWRVEKGADPEISQLASISN